MPSKVTKSFLVIAATAMTSVLLTTIQCQALITPKTSRQIRSPYDSSFVSKKRMTIEFDPYTGRFEADDEDREGGYDVFGSLLRQGPKPFLYRLLDPDRYEQSVLNYMSQTECDREEAQGNMDAYLENENDWIIQKKAEERGAPHINYGKLNMEPSQIVLTSTWTLIVLWYFYSVIMSMYNYYVTIGFLNFHL